MIILLFIAVILIALLDINVISHGRFFAWIRRMISKPKQWWNEKNIIDVYVDPTGFKDIGDAINHYYAEIPDDRKVGTRLNLPPGAFTFSTPVIFRGKGDKTILEGEGTTLTFRDGGLIGGDVRMVGVAFDNCAITISNAHFENPKKDN